MTNDAATFVLVPVDAPTAYWEGWASPCGFQTLEGRSFTIVATHRTGETGRSDAQYIIDRLASGLHWARLQPAVNRPLPNKSWPKLFFYGGPTPLEVYYEAPEARGFVPLCEQPEDYLGSQDYDEDGEIVIMAQHPDTYLERRAEDRKEARGW